MTFLQTDRLILRKLEESDFDDFCAYAIDDEMSRMMGRRMLRTPEDTRWSFDWLKDREPHCYALVEKASGHVIGNLNVCDVPPELVELDALRGKQGCSLSFCISRKHQRQGLTEEAVRAVIDELFRAEGFDYIQCGHFTFNEASARLQQKLGFVPLTVHSASVNGEEVTVVENVLWAPFPR